MTDLEMLLAFEKIKLLRTLYCRLIDAHRWDQVGEILSSDAVLDVSPASETLRGATAGKLLPVCGRENIVSFLRERYGNAKMTLHIVTLPEIYFDDDDNAHGIWRQETYIKEAIPDHQGSGLGFGTVYDRYTRIGGSWLIKAVRVTLDFAV